MANSVEKFLILNLDNIHNFASDLQAVDNIGKNLSRKEQNLKHQSYLLDLYLINQKRS